MGALPATMTALAARARMLAVAGCDGVGGGGVPALMSSMRRGWARAWATQRCAPAWAGEGERTMRARPAFSAICRKKTRSATALRFTVTDGRHAWKRARRGEGTQGQGEIGREGSNGEGGRGEGTEGEKVGTHTSRSVVFHTDGSWV